MTSTTRALTIAATTGAAVSGGVFFAFSTFVMKALRELPDRQGLTAMQAINRAAPNPLFMLALFGTATVSGVLVVGALRGMDDPGSRWVLVATGLYTVGIVLTVSYHVPRNEALALLDPDAASSAVAWVDYAGPWTLLNHVRTATSIGAAVAFAAALAAE